MKANEFRIGNLLWSERDNALLIVSQIGDADRTDVIITTVQDRSKFPLPDGWKSEPIPLTEEWLKKFGFGKSGDHEMGHNTLPIGFYYDYHFKTLTVDFEDKEVYLKGYDTVHQLQNIFFALTGEELTMEETK